MPMTYQPCFHYFGTLKLFSELPAVVEWSLIQSFIKGKAKELRYFDCSPSHFSSQCFNKAKQKQVAFCLTGVEQNISKKKKKSALSQPVLRKCKWEELFMWKEFINSLWDGLYDCSWEILQMSCKNIWLYVHEATMTSKFALWFCSS